LHATTETEDQVKGGFLLDIEIGERSRTSSEHMTECGDERK